jgi:hypothetical protein
MGSITLVVKQRPARVSRIVITKNHNGRYRIGLSDGEMGALSAIVLKLGGQAFKDVMASEEPQELKDCFARIMIAFQKFEKTIN